MTNNMLAKLTKIADKLDQAGKTHLANLVDLVIAHCGKCGMDAKDVCPVCGHPNCDCGCDPKTGKGCKCKEQDARDDYDDPAGRATEQEAHKRRQKEILRGEEFPEYMCPECGPIAGEGKYCSECGSKTIRIPAEQDAKDQPDEIDELIRKMEAEPFEPTVEEPTKEEVDAFMGEEEEHE